MCKVDFAMKLIQLLKKGNTSSGLAALGNLVLAVIKGIAAFFSGSGAMLAEAIHSTADTINQGLVFFGSALSEKKPTKRFPTGFGRVVNLFVLIAVIVIAIMAYETILTGWRIVRNPEPSTNLWLNMAILVFSVCVDGAVLVKTMKEINVESRAGNQGARIFLGAFANKRYAAPPTQLVFYEDIVATIGGLLALIAIAVSHATGQYFWDGIGTMLIGLLLFIIALRTGYDNTIGLIGVAAPLLIEERIARLIMSDADVADIDKMRIVQEGRQYHVEAYVELRKNLTLAEADDIKTHLQAKLLEDPDISDVTLGILESDDEQDWSFSKF